MGNNIFAYIASPYTKGDPAMNTHFQCKIFNQLMDDGIVYPFAPLVSHFQHTLFPRAYEDWIKYDLGIIERMDCCLRLFADLPEFKYLETESSGADGEVMEFRRQEKPVVYSIEELYEWVNKQ